MYGPDILANTLSKPSITDKHGNSWQYHSRSDHHSKVACWGILLDLLATTPLLKRHAENGVIGFGINHEMRDYVRDRKKNLDLVICAPNGSFVKESFSELANKYQIQLTKNERILLDSFPTLRRAPVGGVIMALEAKACMTAHQRALPRFYDELNSSHQTIHGNSEQALAVGFAMVNTATTYLSPDLNKENRQVSPKWSSHQQPKDATLAIDKVKQLPRRSNTGESGYDAIAVIAIDMPNDGSPAKLVTNPPAPQSGDIYHYDTMIARLSALYATRFKDLG